MAKKGKKQAAKPQERSTASYYDLKTEAVDKLVNAKDAPEVSDAEIRKYKSGGRFRIPTWLKVMFVKFWFSGAVCYFFMWGLNLYVVDYLDQAVAISLGMGLVTDLLLNHLLRSFEPEERAYDRWMMVTVRKWWSMILNVIYAGVIFFCIVQTYVGINTALFGPAETSDSILGVEPLLFGIFYMFYDMLFVAIKNGFVRIFRDAEKKVSGGKK